MLRQLIYPGFAAAGLLIAGEAMAQTATPAFDVIIKGGSIVDGSGGTPYSADIGVVGGHIAQIGTLDPSSGKTVINATGQLVSPGFINIHSHAQTNAVATAASALLQGVTTELVNSDGGMTGPADDVTAGLQMFSNDGLAVNVAPFVGFNAVWASVVGAEDRRPTSEEIGRMQTIVSSGMKAGAWGVSSGLDYKPGYYAKTSEVIDIVKPSAPYRAIFTNHDRFAPPNFSSLEGIAETLEVGQKAGLIPVVTHMKLWAKEQGRAGEAIDMLRRSTASGHYAVGDVYPYVFAQSGPAGLLLPGWSVDGGREKMLERFKDPAMRARIAKETEEQLVARVGGPEGLYLTQEKRYLPAAMQEMNAPAGETIIRLLEKGDVRTLFTFGSEDDVNAFYRYPDTVMACDCGATTTTRTHPRNYGAFARFLGEYTRNRKLFPWQEAIRRMTALPASTIGMVDRGLLAPGMVADIVVFDPDTITDRSTIEKPSLLATGISTVLVSGTLAVSDGRVTGEQGGRALLRGQDMPSRPMAVGKAGRWSLGAISLNSGGREGAIKVDADLRQNAGNAGADGKLSITGSGWSITANSFGPVQSADGWVSFSAWGVASNGRAMPLIITLDRKMAGIAKNKVAVTIRSDEASWTTTVPTRQIRGF
ncbi:N-acyl-D-amino-acid deacylase family protein [Sphingobium aquiterrae]|uniref:N-acyl-D-amino-acid deacylase family protein n=1 Tax=Sphingobium aquiterrae TaxID=2038656 RepID=UPI003015994A